ncbi:class F sortase [Nesterenkonia xinjiangensis]|uniref:Sortase (Surface protein transpeptidase) n=1 Tax=Nesterenkonia xinjiangensis TaxID=225327 RepID=A0A7Z0K8B2_9MICC|nr:class F sortase [Nesterenkonia xinjiangensis]NYJ77466.1 sortase (surface protein transpeptidase) [Nesterenkonia xinjiangensis]
MTRPARRTGGLATCAAGVALLLAGCTAPAAPDYAEPLSAERAPAAQDEEPAPGAATPDQERREPGPQQEEPQEEDVPAMEPSVPVSIELPSIGVVSDVMRLGLQDDGVIEVPPYGAGSPAGWYRHSPTPGEVGPSVILGHRNAWEGGPGIFADLPDMAVGDTVEVPREDGSVAEFRVYRTDRFVQEEFPTLDVYGNTAGPELRLITCDGLNQETGELEDNFIVYASLQG